MALLLALRSSESLARVVVDLGQRPFLSYNVPLKGRVGTLESEVLEEFWRVQNLGEGRARPYPSGA